MAMLVERLERTCRFCGSGFTVLPGVVRGGGGVFCNADCRAGARQRHWALDARLAEFWSLVEKTDCCWLWDGYLGPRGYGYFALARKTEPAHRISYRLAHGDIPDGLIVRHTCDVKECVRPDHLILGTQFDNIRDYLERWNRPKCCGWEQAA